MDLAEGLTWAIMGFWSGLMAACLFGALMKYDSRPRVVTRYGEQAASVFIAGFGDKMIHVGNVVISAPDFQDKLYALRSQATDKMNEIKEMKK